MNATPRSSQIPLSKIQQTASDLGIGPSSLQDEQACYEFIVSNSTSSHEQRVADEWAAEQNESDAESLADITSALSNLLAELRKHSDFISANAPLSAAVVEAEAAMNQHIEKE